MADHGMNQPFVRAAFFQQLAALDAMRLRPLLKVDIVQQADDAPEICLIAVAQLLGKPAHDALDRLRVLQMEGLLVIFCQ